MHYRFDCFALHPTSRLLCRDGVTLDVPRKVFDCLAYLIEHRDRAIARDELIAAVWKRSNVSDNQLAHAIVALRRLLDDDGAAQRLIRTVPGFGYHWIGAVGAVEDGDDQAFPTASVAADHIAPAVPAAGDAPSAKPDVAVAATLAPAEASGRTSLRHLWPWPVAGALIVLATFAISWQMRPTAVTSPTATAVEPDPGQTWVLPADLPDGAEGWARIGLMALVAEGLHRQGAQVVPIQKTLTRIAEVPANADLARLAQELDAALVVAPRAYQVRQSWVVALSAQARVGGSIRVDASAQDLLAAGRMAIQRLNQRLKRSGPNLDGSIDETFELIRQAIRARDYEGALLQLSRLSDADRQRPEAELLEVELEIERGQYSTARAKANLELQRLNPETQPVPYARMLVSKAQAMRQLDEEEWPNIVGRAITLLQGANSPRDMAAAIQMRAIAAFLGGRTTDAMRDLARAREMFANLGDEFGVARVTSTMGQLAVIDGRLGEASRQLEQSAAVFEAYGALKMLRVNLHWTAQLQEALLRWEDVLHTLDRLRDLQQKADGISSHEQSRYLGIRFEALMHLGRLNEAQTLLDEQERAVKRDIQENDLGDAGTEDLAGVMAQRAELQIRQGRWRSAAETATVGLAMLQKLTPEAKSVKEPPGRERDRRYAVEEMLRLLVRAQVGADPWSTSAPLPVLTPAEVEALKDAIGIDGRLALAYWNARHDKSEAAEADYRAALAQANARQQNAARALDASEAYIGFLLAAKRTLDAAQILDTLLANWPELPDRSYAAALLVLSVRNAQGDHDGAQAAARLVLKLAGERQPPDNQLRLIEAQRKTDSAARP